MSKTWMWGSSRLLVAISILSVCAFAQVAGRISGTVTDQSGSVIPGASVSITLSGGSNPIAKMSTNAEGYFLFPGLQPVRYDLSVEAQGFRKYSVRDLKVDPGQELALGGVALELGSVAETIEVAAETVQVQTANAEVASTITNDQFARLPQLNRSPLGLLTTQAGVTANGREATTINGLRVSYNNVTVDGINVQDNFIRTNALSFLPNMLLTDQIAEVTVSTSNSSTLAGGGATQVSFVTPSGTNEFHGKAYWFNRNNKFAANGFFSNKDGLERPFLNQNQVGGSIGGPIKKDKLFFHVNYEAVRTRQQEQANRTILTDEARQGIFTYQDTNGVVQKRNILQIAGISPDPFVQNLIGQLPAGSQINNFREGDSSANLLRNTGGYSYNIRDNRTRDNITSKVDYYLNDRHSFVGSYIWNRDIVDRPDLTNNFDQAPPVANDGAVDLMSLAWRATFSPTFTNELRGGFNFAPGIFATYNEYPELYLDELIFSNPVNTFMAQGRYTDTYNLSNTSNWVKGKHNLQFGYQGQFMRTNPFNDAGIVPTYTLGISPNQQGLIASDLPGIRSQDLTSANNMLATLGGLLDTADQTFNITSRDSGFVAGAPDSRNFLFDMHGFYLQDNWRVNRRFTLNVGVRYDYFTVVDERDGLALMPVVQGGDLVGTLRSDFQLDFAGKAVGRPFYNADRNNFAPNIGFAWDVFGEDQRMVIRAGYSVNYVNDNHIQSIRNSIATNSGLTQSRTLSNLSGSVSSGRPTISEPAFQVPRNMSDNYALDPGAAGGIPSTNLVSPYVQQWNFSIQNKLIGGVLEFRYVGNKLTQGFRAFDYNQLNLNAGGFLDDFKRAQNNGFAAQRATGSFDARYNPNVAGSQPLTVFPTLPGGGLLTNGTILNRIQTGQAGDLAFLYQFNGLNGPINFFPNPNALATNIMSNYSDANYHGFQVDFRRQIGNELYVQSNYTFSKALSDTSGDSQTNFEAFVDFANPQLERGRSIFDVTHSFKTNFAYTLPFGEDGRFATDSTFLNKVLGGWSINGFLTAQSGNPFSVQSLRGTVNRGGRSSGQNGTTAWSFLDQSELLDLTGVRMTGDGPYFFDGSAIGTDGRAAQPDGRDFFSGQAFFNPGPGMGSGLALRMFTGPFWWNMDMGIMKTTRIGENQSIEFRAEAINAFNLVNWYIGDQNINSVNFGRITDTQSGPRIMQFGLYYRF